MLRSRTRQTRLVIGRLPPAQAKEPAIATVGENFPCAAAPLSLSLGERAGVRASVNSHSTSAAPLSPSYLYSLDTAKNRLFFTRWLLLTLLAKVTVWSAPARAAEDEPPQKTFLPKSPRAAAYVLSRLSNQELIEAPRSEFVYIALPGRKGLDRKQRVEALKGI